MKPIFRYYKDDDRGNVSLMFAVSFLASLIVVGAAVDYSTLTSRSMKLQDALDAATLFSAKNHNSDTFEADAQKYLTDRTTKLNLISLSSSFTKEGSDMVGSLEAVSTVAFAGILNSNDGKISARTTVSVPETGRPCIVLLDENTYGSLTLNGGAHVDASSCEVHVHSTRNNALAVSSTAELEAKRTCVAGKAQINGGGIVQNLEEQCDPVEDPLEGKIPVPDSSHCDFYNQNYNGGPVTLTPGVYCGSFNFQGNGTNVTMEPGVYVIKNGTWGLNQGKMTGDGVTFYMSDNSSFNFNSGFNVDLKAPEDGDYANILIAETKGGNIRYLNLNDSNGYDFDGVIYLPNRNLTLNSGADVVSSNLMIVANNLTVNNVDLATDTFGDTEETSQEVYISK